MRSPNVQRWKNTMKLKTSGSAPRNRRPVKSLIKAIRILNTLGDGVDGLGITDLSGVLKTPQSRVHRLIVTLETAGYVAFDPPPAKNRLSTRAARLGEQLHHQSTLL